MRLNRVWENFIDDWFIRSGRFVDGVAVSEEEYLRLRGIASEEFTQNSAGDSSRTVGETLEAAGYRPVVDGILVSAAAETSDGRQGRTQSAPRCCCGWGG